MTLNLNTPQVGFFFVLVQREKETGRSLLASIAISRAQGWTTQPNVVAGKPRC